MTKVNTMPYGASRKEEEKWLRGVVYYDHSRANIPRAPEGVLVIPLTTPEAAELANPPDAMVPHIWHWVCGG